MPQPYIIQSPITDLQTLRLEKQKLKEHIELSDEALKAEIEELPSTIMTQVAGNAMSFILNTRVGSIVGQLLGKVVAKPGRKAMMGGMVRETAIIAGIGIAKRLLKAWKNKRKNKAQGNEEDIEPEEWFTT
jgi:hypothetical protein